MKTNLVQLDLVTNIEVLLTFCKDIDTDRNFDR
jgi:hypothetical protein